LWIEHESRKRKREWPYFKIIIKKRMGEKLFFIPFLVQKKVLDSVWLMLP
jgi:hypothetical protein